MGGCIRALFISAGFCFVYETGRGVRLDPSSSFFNFKM